MSSSGRGRGYTGRHHMRPEPRPGDTDVDELEAARTLAELSPRSPDAKCEPKPDNDRPKRAEHKTPEKEDRPKDMEIKYGVLQPEDEKILKELLNVDEQFTPLLVLLEQFSPGEDGIQFNRKLRHFETTVTNMCPDEPRLLQAFATFRAAALLSSSSARKLAAVGASFTRQQRQQLLRSALLNVVMQGTFAKLDVLERANPQFLINAANLMGDYFAEARLCNGNKVHILAAPLLQYMKALLVCNDIRAHRSLATQLMQNGRELLSVLAQELDDLSISIRIRLLTTPPFSIIWLLLSADLCLNKFLPLPNTLQQFYASHLDLSQEDNNPNYSEVSYGSWKKSPEKEDNKSLSEGSEMSLAEKVSQNISQLNLSHEEDLMKPKLRPILGAGAGLLRQEQQTQGFGCSQDNFETWTPKSLSKRYDLNSWRQGEEEKKDETPEPPVFNPTVLPPNLTSAPNFPTVPDYPPPNINRFNNYPAENFPNYLQQGDGAYIQSQYQERPNPSYTPEFQPPQTFVQNVERQNSLPDRVNNEIQKTTPNARRPVENWRKEKSDLGADDANRNRQKNWTRQSRDNVDEAETESQDGGGDGNFRISRANSREIRPGNRQNRRNSSSTENLGTSADKARRHVSDVPRSNKYWDHDDRCDIDYTS
ncbi:uncharacterized protein LOC105389913 isoform X2 [Plutella xylostella]|uniref:uncharacterized protein LOC105389913 isoform X2 n=1 Tax=Plutella xylostella TaxID=51655 RepID=UPI0005D068F4|nr:uncharacterized protein LOC105389913 isoform X2 [Plutella xylostella]